LLQRANQRGKSFFIDGRIERFEPGRKMSLLAAQTIRHPARSGYGEISGKARIERRFFFDRHAAHV